MTPLNRKTKEENTLKKILTLALVAAMLTATGITAFAADIDQDTTPPTGTTSVTMSVAPSYTVSIPASVTLGDADVTADITASDVILEDGKQIKVDLTAASNTASGSTFNAKNGDSAVTYTISAGDKTIAVNDTVATFTANGSKTLTFSAADKSAATAAGAHTETLTFTIGVEAAATQKTLTISAPADASEDKSVTITYTTGQKWGEIDLPDGWSFNDFGYLTSGDWFIVGSDGPIEAGNVIDETLNYYLYKD